jgi:hypothetical protein
MTFLINGHDLIHLPGFQAMQSSGVSIHLYDAEDQQVSSCPLRYETFHSPIPSWMIPGEKFKTIDHDLMLVDWVVKSVEQVNGEWQMIGKALRWGRPVNLEWANDKVAAAVDKVVAGARVAA